MYVMKNCMDIKNLHQIFYFIFPIFWSSVEKTVAEEIKYNNGYLYNLARVEEKPKHDTKARMVHYGLDYRHFQYFLW